MESQRVLLSQTSSTVVKHNRVWVNWAIGRGIKHNTSTSMQSNADHLGPCLQIRSVFAATPAVATCVGWQKTRCTRA